MLYMCYKDIFSNSVNRSCNDVVKNKTTYTVCYYQLPGSLLFDKFNSDSKFFLIDLSVSNCCCNCC